MLSYYDDVTPQALAKIRKHILEAPWGSPPKIAKLFLQASGGSPFPTPETAEFWRKNTDAFVTLCGLDSSVEVLLALGVPVDLLAQHLSDKHLLQLPYWQNGGACTHPANYVQVDPTQSSSSAVVLRCRRCLLKIRVLP